jgi:hypothetical protein
LSLLKWDYLRKLGFKSLAIETSPDCSENKLAKFIATKSGHMDAKEVQTIRFKYKKIEKI